MMDNIINGMTKGDVHPKMLKIASRFMFDAPFFGELLLHFHFHEIDENEAKEIRKMDGMNPNEREIDVGDGQKVIVPTASVQISPRLQFNWYRPFIESLTEQELEGLIVHELLHIVNLSHDRLAGAGYGSNYMRLWNIAADYAINTVILEAVNINGRKVSLPYTNLTPDELKKQGYDGKITHEDIMRWLVNRQKNLNNNGSGTNDQEGNDEETGNGNGSTTIKENETGEEKENGEGAGNGSGEEKENGEEAGDGSGEEKENEKKAGAGSENNNKNKTPVYRPVDSHHHLDNEQSDVNELVRENIRNIIRGAHTKAKVYGSGSMNDVLSNWIESQLQPPKVNWKVILRQVIKTEIGKLGGIDLRTWNRPHRREYLPSKKTIENNITIAVDTSGSVFSGEVMKEFFSEVEAILKASGKMKQANLLLWDTTILRESQYKSGDYKNIQPVGGGGTDIQCVYDWIKSKKTINKDLLIVLTDGVFGYNVETYSHHKTVFAIVGDNQEDIGKILGGKTVFLS